MQSKSAYSDDIRAANFALLSATLIIAQQVAGKATRDSLFLYYFEITDLPKVVIAGGILSIISVLTMSKLLTRFGPAHIVPNAFSLSAILFFGEWVLIGLQPGIATILLYLHIAVFSAVLISGFWSVVNERFDPHSAKKTITKVTAAATFGGIVGGIIAERVTTFIDLQAMLVVLAVMHGLCGYSVSKVGRKVHDPKPLAEPGLIPGIQLLSKNAYLQLMAVLMTLAATISALLDYALKSEAAARFESSESLVTFFATFYAGAGVLSFLLQSTIGRNILKKIGVGKTLAIQPGIVMTAGLLSMLVTNLWSIVFTRGAQTVLSNSFFRSGFELLYAPLSPEKKRPTKTIIDVGADRLGDILGGSLVLVLVSIMSNVPTALILGFAIFASALTLVVVFRLHRGYVEQLAENLRSRPLSLFAHLGNKPKSEDLQATPTIETNQGRSTPQRPSPVNLQTTPPEIVKPETPIPEPISIDAKQSADPIIDAIRDLRSNIPNRIQRTLKQEKLDSLLVPHVIPLLNHSELVWDAVKALERVGPSILGQLVDGLLETSNPLVVRIRLPRILESYLTPRAIDGLLLGLSTEPFEVRYKCGQAMLRMTAENEFLSVPREAVFSAVQREVDVDENIWKSSIPSTDKLDLSDSKSAPEHGKLNRRLEHVFTLLGLVLDREAIQLSLHAISSEDSNLRGTALEYLDNVLPEPIRVSLWRYIPSSTSIKKSKRSRAEIVNDLLQSAKSLVIDRDKLVEYPMQTEGKYLIISLTGELDLNVSPRVRRQLLKYLDEKRNVLVDMSAVEYIDSSAIASLVEGLQHAKKNKLEFGLLGVGDTILKVLQLTRLDKVFPIYTSLETLK